MWRLSGIERDVYLYSTPKQYIADYKLNASLDKDKYGFLEKENGVYYFKLNAKIGLVKR